MDRDTFIQACRERGAALERALRLMHRDYAGALMREGWLMLRDEHEAQDLVQDTLVKAWQRCDGYLGQSELFPWLKGILRHAALDRLRGRPRPAALDDAPDLESALAEFRPGLDQRPERQALQAEAERVFHDCARRFAADEPEAATMIHWVAEDGLTPAQIADVLGRSPGATREYLSQCRKKARRYFEPWHRLVAAAGTEEAA